MDYREFLRNVRSRPGMYSARSELGYDKLVAFITGLDIGSHDTMLAGFREFLILKLDGGSNLAWSGLVVQLCVPDADWPLGGDKELAAVDGLFDLLDEFLAEATGPRARIRIYHEYFLWLQQQSWYDIDLERFHTSPAPSNISIGEAATRLGLDKSAMLDLIARGTLRPARVGAELYVVERHLPEVAAQLTAQHTIENSE